VSSYLPRLNIKHGIGVIALRENALFLQEEHKFSADADGREKSAGIELVLFFRHWNWGHGWVPLSSAPGRLLKHSLTS